MSVLKEELFHQQIKDLFDQVIQDCSKQNLNKCITWDMFKLKVKEFSINYTKQNAKNKHDIIDKLEKDIDIPNNALKERATFVLSSKRDNLQEDIFNIMSERSNWCPNMCTSIVIGEQTIECFSNNPLRIGLKEGEHDNDVLKIVIKGIPL